MMLVHYRHQKVIGDCRHTTMVEGVSKGGYISPRETFAFETRVKRWVWRVMKDFNIKRQDVDRENPSLDRIAAGFCKIRLGIVQFNKKNKVEAACWAIKRQFRINHYNQGHKKKEITKEGAKNGIWTLPILMLLQEHMRHFCKDLPMIQYNPSRHHQKALSKHIQANSEVKYLEPVKDEEIPLPKKSSHKRKASGISTTEEPPKYRTVVIEKRVPMRKAMLDFLN